ncbi:MAG: dipeptide ABC transporter ATP-binding protein DppD, partial [Candidatus Hydrogenedens sp.]
RLQSLVGKPPDLKTLTTRCPFAERCPYAVEKCYVQPFISTEMEPLHSTSCWRIINHEIELEV